MTTALCKMICVLRNKWCIEMTNGAAEVQLGCKGCSIAEVLPSGWMRVLCSAKNNKNAFALSR